MNQICPREILSNRWRVCRGARLAGIGLSAFIAVTANTQEWPSFRGPGASGVAIGERKN